MNEHQAHSIFRFVAGVPFLRAEEPIENLQLELLRLRPDRREDFNNFVEPGVVHRAQVEERYILTP